MSEAEKKEIIFVLYQCDIHLWLYSAQTKHFSFMEQVKWKCNIRMSLKDPPHSYVATDVLMTLMRIPPISPHLSV